MSTNNPSLVVQRLDRATDLAVSTGLPVKCLVFPATGGLQAIDAAGNILPLVGPSGSLIPSADNVDDLGTAALRWRKLFIGTSIDVPSINAGGSGDVNLGLSGTGNGVVNPQSPLIITPTLRTGAAALDGALQVIGFANTAVSAATEAPDVFFDLARTVTWAAGNITEQRAVNIQAPTYVISGGASTITTAATLSIADAPTAGAATVIARSYALHVPSGLSNLAGGVGVSNITNNNIVTSLNVARLVDSPVSGVAGVGANNIGSRITITTANSSGAQVMSGFASGVLSDATAASEVGYLSLGGAFAGTGSEALRLIGLTGTIVNRLNITPAADSGVVTVAVAGGTVGSVALSANGTAGVTSLRGSVATNIVAVDNGGGASAARLGFYNIGPVARQVLATGSGATVDQVITALQNLGLLAQA